MKVLVACEFSGRVRDAFRARGHDTTSCDLVPSELPEPHIMGNVLEYLDEGWDLLIAFPPCTYLSNAGACWHNGSQEQDKALDFVVQLLSAPVPRIALENPVGAISYWYRKPDQIVEPYWFGDSYAKHTCLWLDNLPLLQIDRVCIPEDRGWYNRGGGTAKGRRHRSRTPLGLARAMAEQWSP